MGNPHVTKENGYDSAPIHIACASDAGYFIGLFVTVASICSSTAPTTRLRFHILDMGLTQQMRDALETFAAGASHQDIQCIYHTISAELFEGFPPWKGSLATYARLLLPNLLPDEDYVIYTDADTLWKRDVRELWAMRDEAVCIHAVPDGSGLALYSSGARQAEHFKALGYNLKAENYYCAGLLLMNLARLRADDFCRKSLEFLTKYKKQVAFLDQDVLNLFYPAPQKGKLLAWQWTEFVLLYGQRETESPRIWHYVRHIPWTCSPSYVSACWWEELAKATATAERGSLLHDFHCLAKRHLRKYKFLASRFGFICRYGLAGLFNRKILKKRWAQLHPTPSCTIPSLK